MRASRGRGCRRLVGTPSGAARSGRRRRRDPGATTDPPLGYERADGCNFAGRCSPQQRTRRREILVIRADSIEHGPDQICERDHIVGHRLLVDALEGDPEVGQIREPVLVVQDVDGTDVAVRNPESVGDGQSAADTTRPERRRLPTSPDRSPAAAAASHRRDSGTPGTRRPVRASSRTAARCTDVRA